MIIRILIFYVLAFLFTILLGGGQQAAQLSSETVILAQLGPGLAALLMLLIFRKDRFRISFFDRTIPASRYLLALAIPLGGATLVWLIHRLFFAADAAATVATPWMLLLWFPLGAIGEELGWRGYLHKRLDAGMAGLISSVIVGVLWALWHVGMYQNGALYMAFFVLLMVSYSVVIYALVASTGFNVLLAAVFHLGINIGSLLAYPVVNQVSFMIVNSLVWAAIALGLVLTRRYWPAPDSPRTAS